MLNLLVLSYEHDRVDGFDGPTALLQLRRLAEQKDDAFFARAFASSMAAPRAHSG